ncbi:D-alanyl-D-alanine carboxypeptidase family protein [Arthrobacter sp. ISL-28]|uniref:M15 family metallopeptidase n=1 Tax=Arthrobacter sp. ISL-28 TaxID=2819108 RepID=UPI001BEA0341|nr:M15 family metallopeptidase [Arthrobacter sp. ISL-28]MBT2521274.1 M15 family metallopeptidase [Arthrobacter sp. ISL-28]
MCYDCSSAQDATAGNAGTPPSRRTIARLLLTGAGLSALAACTPPVPPPPPSATGGTTESLSSGSAPPGALSGSPSSPSPDTGTPSAAPPASASAPTSPSPSAPPTTVSATPGAPVPPSAAARLPKQYSLTNPTSPWLVVNKRRPLKPANFVPGDLVEPRVALAVSGEAALLNRTTAAAAERMFAAGAADGVTMTLASGYRSYATQKATYNGYVSARGQAAADTASARPGYSEHQTGWAFDIGDGGGACSFQPCFAEQPAAVWAKANAYRFGFVVRYPWMLHSVTGYYYEPWHLRYVGVAAASDMRQRGISTLEEYFGLEAAPGYR